MNFRKLIFLFAIISGVCFSSQEVEGKEIPDTISASRAFVEMPATVLDLLSRSTRQDMLDYYAADSLWNAVNANRGLSRLDTVTSDYLKVRITNVSDLQFKVLKDRKGNDIVMTIYTTGAEDESRDSDIRFFNADMQELDRMKYLELPELKAFFDIPKGSLTKMKEIEELIPFYTVEYTAYPGNDKITGMLTIGDFMNLEDMKLIDLFKKPDIHLKWDGKKLKYSDK